METTSKKNSAEPQKLEISKKRSKFDKNRKSVSTPKSANYYMLNTDIN